MAQWRQIQKQVQFLSTKTLNELYPQTFPMDVRCYLANWIEEQSWEDITVDSPEQEAHALSLLEQITSLLQDLAQRNTNVVEKLRLQQFSRNMSVFRSQPLQLVKTVQEILRKERVLLSQTVVPTVSHFPPSPSQLADSNRDVDVLVLKVLEIQSCRQKIHQLQEELNWERQNFESMQVQLQSHPSNGLDPNLSEQVVKLQSHIQQLEFNGKAIAKTRVQLLQEAVCCLEQCQLRLIHSIQAWRREQHLATIGAPFDDNLAPLQTWCEQLFGVNLKLKQEVLIEPIAELQERLGLLLQTLVQSSLMVDKQPPQVIKTQSKFSTTVRYLLGEKVAPGKPVLLKAQIITEMQARNLGQLGTIPLESVGELINNTAILEHASTKSTCATFRNMSIKKIKRADRKGSESVTEEKFALLFSTEISVTGCDSPISIQMISLPVVVIVHGSQDNNALATILWDCAFSEPDRVPFVVPERVPWKQMCMTLDSKFTSEVQTQRRLDRFNQHFLAQKIFDKPDISGDYSNMLVSWAQFNKEVLPGRPFTFWQWFDGVLELTKKHLKSYWSDGLIFGFIGKQHLHLILQDRPNGTFLLRFSDSEIGGITIAYVAPSENGGRKIQNIQPFTKRDLEIRCLGDRIRDIELITHVYPDLPKNDVFKKYYTADDSQPLNHGYIGVTMQTKVAGDTRPASPSVSSMTPRAETPQDTTLPPTHPSYPAVPVFPNMDPMGNGGVLVGVPNIPSFFPQPLQTSYPTDSRVPPGPFQLDPSSIGLFPDLSESPQQTNMELEDILESQIYPMSS
ncbi:signal transducer and activator of transcription 5B-like isoform X1 [Arapaima gigas]